MSHGTLIIEGLGADIAEVVQQYSHRRMRLAIMPEIPTGEADERPLNEIIGEIWAGMPDEELAKLPADLSDQLDHYVYGTPKR